ncbi:MAG TPA: hypothetical protein VF476_16425 [Chitinophagaceae bacterium]
MKKFILLHLSLLTGFLLAAQQPLQLVVYIDPGSKLVYKQGITMRGYLKNTSGETVKISKPTPYAMWKTDKDHWVLMKNGNAEKPFKFVEPPDRKFKKTDLLDLKPNDSIIVSTYNWILDGEGDYEIRLQYEQLKANIDPVYVEAALVNDRYDFAVESSPVKFKIVKPVPVVNRELMDYQKLMYSTTYYDASPNSIYLDLNNVRKIKMSTPKNYRLMEDCKNVQFLELEGFNADSIPELFASWNLQYLSFYTDGSNKVKYIPTNFCKDGNLRYLHCCWGMADSLPAFTYNQPKLEFLRVFATQINKLDERLGNLVNLKELDLSNITNTVALPESFKQLVNLESLSLVQVGGLTDVSSIENLPKLKMLRIFADGINRDNEVLKRMKAKNKELMIFTKFGMVM